MFPRPRDGVNQAVKPQLSREKLIAYIGADCNLSFADLCDRRIMSAKVGYEECTGGV